VAGLDDLSDHDPLNRIAYLHSWKIIISSALSHPMAKTSIQGQPHVFCTKETFLARETGALYKLKVRFLDLPDRMFNERYCLIHMLYYLISKSLLSARACSFATCR
jgi:hypothetical protein